MEEQQVESQDVKEAVVDADNEEKQSVDGVPYARFQEVNDAKNTLRDELDKDKINGNFDHMRQFKFDHKDIKAFGILGISVGLKWEKVQDKFKLLVKKFHPDINAGNKKYEEKLKLITLAYTQLKKTYREKIDTRP